MSEASEHDTERVREAFDAAARRDKQAFDDLWNAMTEGEQWRMRAHARVGSIARAAGGGR